MSFETDCDPQSEICFVGCEDDECLVEYPYAVITRHAAHLYQQCGPDVTDCEHAFSCEGDTSCSISYCNTATENDTCFTATETSKSKP